jgi:hypothetical protein
MCGKSLARSQWKIAASHLLALSFWKKMKTVSTFEG